MHLNLTLLGQMITFAIFVWFTMRIIWPLLTTQMDARKKRDGQFLDNLGTYDPIKHELLQIHADRLKEWVAKGAVCSDAVTKIVRLHARQHAA